jgi:hypothetical protein
MAGPTARAKTVQRHDDRHVHDRHAARGFVQFAAIPRWQWIVLAIAVGALVGYVTDAADSELYGIDVQGYGVLLPDQQEFENGLVQDYNGIRLFSNPVVYPHWITDPKGHRTLVYIVSGQYWDGRQEVKDGKAVAEWVPRCIITQTPYRPRMALSLGSNSSVAQFPSVVEFLDALRHNYNVSYHYAWWALHPVLTWIAGCAVVIGGIWPTLINLLAYGSFTRPKDVKPVSLWKIRSPKATATAPIAPISYSPPAPQAEEEPSPPPPSSEPDETVQPAVAPLANSPLELAPEGPKELRAYRAEKDDFYPTERHVSRQKPE